VVIYTDKNLMIIALTSQLLIHFTDLIMSSTSASQYHQYNTEEPHVVTLNISEKKEEGTILTGGVISEPRVNMDFKRLGSINQEGFLKNLDRKGFNIPKSLGELYSNSIDAHATEIHTYNRTDGHMLVDDGDGMDPTGITKMFDFYRENHVNDQSIGVSGMGAKASLKKLSLNRECRILTKKKDQSGYTVTIPWDKMIERKKYTDMIDHALMSDADTSLFTKYLGGGKEDHGTIIILPYSEELDEELTRQFTDSKTISNPTERFDCIFSKFKQVTFRYTSNDAIAEPLAMYDFFGGECRDYYKGIDRNIIKIFKSSQGQLYDYVLVKNNTHLAIQASGRGLSKEPSEYHNYMTNECVTSFNVNVAVRLHDDYFHPNLPKCPGASTQLYGYDREFFEDETIQREHLSKPDLVRNGLKIGKFNLETIKFNSARANGKSCLLAAKTRTEIVFSTKSNQDNILDSIFSIQENKNQLNAESVPKRIIRLIEYCIKQKSNNVWDYFNDRVEEVESKRIRDDEDNKRREQQKEVERREQERIDLAKKREQELIDKEKALAKKLKEEEALMAAMSSVERQKYIDAKRLRIEKETKKEQDRIDAEKKADQKEKDRLLREAKELARRALDKEKKRIALEAQKQKDIIIAKQKLYFDRVLPGDSPSGKLEKLAKFMKEGACDVSIYAQIVLKLADSLG